MSAGHHPLIRRSPRDAAHSRRGHERVGAWIRRRSREERIFAGCLALIALHLAVLALVFPGDAGALVRVGVLGVAGVGPAVLCVLFVSRGPVVRVLLAGLIGLGATVAGLATSVPHAVLTGMGGAEVTGILATVSGIALVALAFWIALRGRRLLVKLAGGIIAVFVIGQWLIAPAINAGVATHAPREAIRSARTLAVPGARDVTFSARDGTRLLAWYVPSRNGAAIVLLHGSHGTRVDTLPQLRMLSSAGYGILAYDARGHGQSAGQTNALGWAGANDLAGAVAFLDHQPGISPRRIAALGLSMGAEEALRAAGSGVGLHAVVADGAGASTLGDDQLVPHGLAPVFLSETWLTMRTIELVSGETEPAPLKSIVARIQIPVLLIASNATNEHAIDSAYRALIGPSATLWYVPDATHTNAFGRHPQAYTTRVLTFLSNAAPSH
jgi:uncharacterized protein